jgi:hypothetical protein
VAGYLWTVPGFALLFQRQKRVENEMAVLCESRDPFTYPTTFQFVSGFPNEITDRMASFHIHHQIAKPTPTSSDRTPRVFPHNFPCIL